MPHAMFSLVGGVLGTLFVAAATYFSVAQSPEPKQTVHQPVMIEVASQPLLQPTAQ